MENNMLVVEELKKAIEILETEHFGCEIAVNVLRSELYKIIEETRDETTKEEGDQIV